jgi:hypothetical protein
MGLTPQQLQSLQMQQHRQQAAAVAAAQQSQAMWMQQPHLMQQQMLRGQPLLHALHSPLLQPGLLGVPQGGYNPAMAAAAAAAVAAAAQAAVADAGLQQQQQQQNQQQGQQAGSIDDTLCGVCQRNPRRVLLLPCKHLVACVQCSETLEMAGSVCPVCSQPFNRRVTLHSNAPGSGHSMA